MRYLLLLVLLALPGQAESDLLPGTYQVRYWGLGEGRVKPPGTDETLTIAAQGSVYSVTWTFGDGSKLPGVGIFQGSTLSVAYVDKGAPGLIVYDLVIDEKTVRLANGHWTTGLAATQLGCEEASRPR